MMIIIIIIIIDNSISIQFNYERTVQYKFNKIISNTAKAATLSANDI